MESPYIMVVICNSYCMGARAIHQILALSPRAAGPRASANINYFVPILIILLHVAILTELCHPNSDLRKNGQRLV